MGALDIWNAALSLDLFPRVRRLACYIPLANAWIGMLGLNVKHASSSTNQERIEIVDQTENENCCS